MKILLLNPPRFRGLNVIREDRCEIVERDSLLPPYSLAQLAALLRKSNEVELIDANCLDLNIKKIDEIINIAKFDTCIFRFTPNTFNDDMLVASSIKKASKSATTIGICWTLKYFPQDVLRKSKDLDVFVIDEPLIVVPSLIDELANNGQLKNVNGIIFRNGHELTKTSKQIDPFIYDVMPMPAYDLLPSLDKYYARTKHGSPYSIIISSKGCPYRCIYCTVADTGWNPRSAKNIVDEIKYLKDNHNLRVLSFFDETFTFNRARVEEICNMIIGKDIDIKWYCNTRSNKIDIDLLKLMRRAGCRGLSLGIESGSQSILDNAKKGITVSQNEKAISDAKSAGIKTYCSFMFGLPGENNKTINETIEFVKRTLPNGAQFNVVVPYPGTELYRIAIDKGWIKEIADWTCLSQHVSIMRTDEMSTEMLESARKEAYRQLYFNPAWLLSNLSWIFKEPDSFMLASKYYLRFLGNYLFHGMKFSH